MDFLFYFGLSLLLGSTHMPNYKCYRYTPTHGTKGLDYDTKKINNTTPNISIIIYNYIKLAQPRL